MNDRFPVLNAALIRRVIPRCPQSIPWGLVKAHETRATRNHYQSLSCLAGRGGLSPTELWFVLNDRPWIGERMNEEEAVDALIAAVKAYEAKGGMP